MALNVCEPSCVCVQIRAPDTECGPSALINPGDPEQPSTQRAVFTHADWVGKCTEDGDLSIRASHPLSSHLSLTKEGDPLGISQRN